MCRAWDRIRMRIGIVVMHDLDRHQNDGDPQHCPDDNPDLAKKYRIRTQENVVYGTGYPYLRRHRTGTVR
jgi:hypothetical protein